MRPEALQTRPQLTTHVRTYFFGGMLIWGLGDGLRVALSSRSLFFNLLDVTSFVILSAFSYGVFCALLSLPVTFVLVAATSKISKFTPEKSGLYATSGFFSVTICIFFVLFLYDLMGLKSLLSLFLLLLVSSVLFFLLFFFFIFIFKKLNLPPNQHKSKAFFKNKAVLVCLALVIGSAGLFRGYQELKSPPGNFHESDKPNIILVSLDTLGANHVGCYGYDKKTTPHLDDFAEQAVLFSNAFSVSKWTLPSHMSIMTSLYPSVHGVTGKDSILNEEWTTLAEVLKRSGYYTGAYVDGQPLQYIGGKRGFSKGFNFYNHFPGDLYFYCRFERLFLWRAVVRFLRYSFRPWTGYQMHAEEITDIAAKWLKYQGNKGPFFLFLHYFDIHGDYGELPYEAPPHYLPDTLLVEILKNSPVFKGASERLKELSERLRTGDITLEEFDEDELGAARALYDAGIRYTDHHIGRLLRMLDRLNLASNTIVIITSDHGEEFLEHQQFLHTQYYNEIIKIPLIMRWPGKLPANRKIDSHVRTVDIAPTILAFLGISLPEQFQGSSLLPFINEKNSVDELLCFGGGDDFNDPPHNAIFVIDRGKKLIVNDEHRANYAYHKGRTLEFYDLLANSGEILEESLKQDNEIERLMRKLDAWAEECRHLAQKVPERKSHKLDKKTEQRLKALGYIK